MGDKTGIQWTDATWNPIRGCTRVSEGCRNCYAETVAARFSGPGQPYEGLANWVTRAAGQREARWTGKVELIETGLDQPRRWKKPRRIFVNSMSDLFHESVPDDWINRIFGAMALAPQHVFQILTKRPERMRAFIRADPMGFIEGRAKAQLRAASRDPMKPVLVTKTLAGTWPWPHVWLGVSVEDQASADARIPVLLDTPAAVRFLSCEPLLGPVELSWSLGRPIEIAAGFIARGHFSPGLEKLRRLDWIIAGGESGRGARPIHPDWARSLRDQCQSAGVPFFFKQWGEWSPLDLEGQRGCPVDDESLCRITFTGHKDATGWPMQRVGKAKAGRMLDRREWDQFPASFQARA